MISCCHIYQTSIALCAVFATSMPLMALQTSGPYPTEIAQWTADQKASQREAGKKLLASLQEAARRGEKEVRIPQGEYRFADNTGGKYPTHLRFDKELDGMTLDFQNSTLWFETSASGIVLSRTTNVTLRNVKLDWDPLPFMQGVITKISAEKQTAHFKLDAGYENPLPKLKQSKWRGRGMVFDLETRELKPQQHGCSFTFDWNKQDKDGAYEVQFNGFYKVPLAKSGFEVGDPLVLLRRQFHAIRIEGCTNTLLEDVTLYSAPFIAYQSSSGTNITFRRCNILRRPGTNRLIAGNADGINCSNMAKGPLIEECKFETLGDDFVNVHGHLARVLKQEGPKAIVVSVMNRQGEITEPVEVEFRERKTMHLIGKRQATAELISQWNLDKTETIADLSHKWYSGDAAGLAYSKTVRAHRLKLDEPIDLKGDIVVICETFSSPGAIIRNNHFKGSLATGLRLQSPHVTVENNTIERTLGPGMTLKGQASFWGEGPYVYDAKVTNNRFIDNAIGGSIKGKRATLIIKEGDTGGARLSREIQVNGNYFSRSGGPAILTLGLTESSINNNRIDGYNLLPQFSEIEGSGTVEELKAAIIIEEGEAVESTGNRIENPGPYASGSPLLKK